MAHSSYYSATNKFKRLMEDFKRGFMYTQTALSVGQQQVLDDFVAYCQTMLEATTAVIDTFIPDPLPVEKEKDKKSNPMKIDNVEELNKLVKDIVEGDGK